MTIKRLEEQKQQRVAELAQEYRQKGYQVTVDPQPEDLPDFLTAFPIDVIANNDTENVIIEVRTRASLTKSPALTTIAEAVAGKVGWRFELVVTNPKGYNFLDEELVLIEQSNVDYRLAEAKELAAQEYGEAAMLLAWSALEAMLRHTAQSEQLDITQENPNYLLKNLFAYGLLSKEQLQILQDSLRARNVIAHGYRSQEQLFGLLDKLLHVADQLSNTKMAA